MSGTSSAASAVLVALLAVAAAGTLVALGALGKSTRSALETSCLSQIVCSPRSTKSNSQAVVPGMNSGWLMARRSQRVRRAVDAEEDEANATPSGHEEVERQKHEAEADPADEGEGKDGREGQRKAIASAALSRSMKMSLAECSHMTTAPVSGMPSSHEATMRT